MQISLLQIFHIVIAAIYLILAVFVMRKRGFRDVVTLLLVIYTCLAICWEGVRAGSKFIFFNLTLPENVILHLPYYVLFLLVFFFFLLTINFLINRKSHLIVWLFALLLLGIVLILDFNWFGLPNILWERSTVFIDRRSVSFAALVVGWGIWIALTIYITTERYRIAERVVVKHRIAYWVLSVILIFAGGIAFFLLLDVLSSTLHVLGAITAFYIITVHRLPDSNITLRRVAGTVVVGILGLSIYTAGFWALQTYMQDFVKNTPLFAGLFLALIFLALLNPILLLTRKWIDKIIFGTVKDPNRIFREYSQSISHIMDLDQLSTVAVGLISETLDVNSGVLFTVDAEFSDEGERHYRLKGISSKQGGQPVNAVIPLESPIALQLGDKQLPLMQSEIDVLPKFRYLSAQERSWLNSQEMDVYVPIHFKDEWVGVFVLGPKKNGASFYDDDMALLTTLANQTAVALQYARLVGSLVRINNEFRRAYSSMEEAHSKLAKIDRTKSDFISVASHELRTPLTVLSGYSQMLLDDPTFSENAYYGKVIGGIFDGTSRLHEIVDSMLDVAKIDTRALELASEPVNLNLVLQSVCKEFKKAIKERELILKINEMENFKPVQGDPEALKKIFYHLIMNAIKYTPDGGKVAISGCEIATGDARFPPGGVEIVISDNGIGIDPRFKDLIFTKFYQTGEVALHSSGKTKFKGGGPGLGLAIVRGIVQAHGGRVWADSPGYDEDKNPGSHFHVILPFTSDVKVIPPGEIDV